MVLAMTQGFPLSAAPLLPSHAVTAMQTHSKGVSVFDACRSNMEVPASVVSRFRNLALRYLQPEDTASGSPRRHVGGEEAGPAQHLSHQSCAMEAASVEGGRRGDFRTKPAAAAAVSAAATLCAWHKQCVAQTREDAWPAGNASGRSRESAGSSTSGEPMHTE
jgi:hypothetical protein